MRISKAPEERKREMIETAMKLFATKGYESTSMSDIAREMNVVPGLCYRYFKSKEALYHEALNVYAYECVQPMMQVMHQDYDSLEEYITNMHSMFRNLDGKEKYHDFFHREGNEIFHWELEHCIVKLLEPEMTFLLQSMKDRGLIKIEDCKNTAIFIIHGEMPILNDDSIDTEEKLAIVTKLLTKVVM